MNKKYKEQIVMVQWKNMNREGNSESPATHDHLGFNQSQK